MKDLIRTCVKTTELHVNSNDIRSTMGDAIDHKLKKEMEGMCCDDGYVMKDSVDIIERSMGKIVNVNNHSKVLYTIKYTCSILSPVKGCEIDCYINSVTKIGAVAFIKHGAQVDFRESPLLIIIPKVYSPSADTLEENKRFKVEVVATRLKYKSAQIHVVAKLV